MRQNANHNKQMRFRPHPENKLEDPSKFYDVLLPIGSLIYGLMKSLIENLIQLMVLQPNVVHEFL